MSCIEITPERTEARKLKAAHPEAIGLHSTDPLVRVTAMYALFGEYGGSWNCESTAEAAVFIAAAKAEMAIRCVSSGRRSGSVLGGQP